MKIVDVFKFNKSLKLINEWNNFKHKIAHQTSSIIKKLALKIKEKYPKTSHLKTLEVIKGSMIFHHKHNLDFEYVVENENLKIIFKGVEDDSDSGRFYVSPQKDFYTIVIFLPIFISDEKFDNYILNFKENIFKIQSTLNHELTHYFNKKEKENDYNDYITISGTDCPSEMILYFSQEEEMKSYIQGMMPYVKGGNTLLDSIKKKFNKTFSNDMEYIKNFLITFYVSYIINDKNMREKYLSILKQDGKYTDFVKDYNLLMSMRKQLLNYFATYCSFMENILNKKRMVGRDIHPLMDYDFYYNYAEKSFSDLNPSQLEKTTSLFFKIQTEKFGLEHMS